MSHIAKVLYTARTETTGGRETAPRAKPTACSTSGLRLPVLRASGPIRATAAAGWSACFESAIALAARKRKIVLPAEISIDAEVDLNLGRGGYFLSARLSVRLPGVERNAAKRLLEEANNICPYSKAICDNIEVTINLSELDYSPVS